MRNREMIERVRCISTGVEIRGRGNYDENDE